MFFQYGSGRTLTFVPHMVNASRARRWHSSLIDEVGGLFVRTTAASLSA
jgi:hypothetical protein